MQDWQEQAELLRCGSRRRITHCKDDNSMLISHDLKGLRSHCFRCGFHGFIPHGFQRIEDLMRRAKEFKEQSEGEELRLPKDYTLEVPSRARAWYLQYGITPELAEMYGIGYTEYLDRVVLPVYGDGELQAVQMRAVDSDVKPKYLNPSSVPIQDVLFESEEGQSDYGILTEDILSCIKVGQVLSAVSTLGTKMSDARAWKISEKYKNCFVWYDSDIAGRTGARKAVARLELLGVNCWNVRTVKDPKCYTRREIKQILKENIIGS